jgi:hypothetical protein
MVEIVVKKQWLQEVEFMSEHIGCKILLNAQGADPPPLPLREGRQVEII